MIGGHSTNKGRTNRAAGVEANQEIDGWPYAGTRREGGKEGEGREGRGEERERRGRDDEKKKRGESWRAESKEERREPMYVVRTTDQPPLPLFSQTVLF